MPQLKLIKWMLSVLMLVCMLTLAVTSYNIRHTEASNKAFAEKITMESKQREQQLATRLNTDMQSQFLGIREGFINYQIDQVAQTRKLVALEVAMQLKQAKEIK